MRKRTDSDFQKEANGHKRARRPHRKYKFNPYSTPSILGKHSVFIDNLTVFSSSGRLRLYTILRQIAQIPHTSRVFLDFSMLSSVKISAAVVLYAHIETMLIVRAPSKVTWCRPLDELTNEQLRRLGIWTLLGEPYKNNSASIPICSVSQKDKSLGNDLALREAITYAKAAIEKISGIQNVDEGDTTFSAISESFSNVWQHAYSDDFEVAHKTLGQSNRIKKWWIALHLIDKQLFMAVYDVGVGIPASTRRKQWHKELLLDLKSALTGKNRDCADIEAAMKYGTSRFKKQGRGNGLPAIKKFVDINPNGFLAIMSGRGLYRYRANTNSENWTEVSDVLPGTLIQWNVALTENHDETEND